MVEKRKKAQADCNQNLERVEAVASKLETAVQLANDLEQKVKVIHDIVTSRDEQTVFHVKRLVVEEEEFFVSY